MAYAQPFPLASPQANQLPKNVFGPDLAVRLVCPECRDPNPNIIEEFGSGDLVCGTCGLILGDRVVDTRSEWRTFANDEGDDPSRVGAAIDPLMEGMEQMDTVISYKDGGSGVARELQRAASRSQNTRSERNMLQAFRDISSWCDQFSLPKTISDIAKQLYKRADEEKLLRGKSLDAVIAACIFIACRQAHVPRTFREMCTLTHVPKKTLGQCYKTLEKAFNLAAAGSNNTTQNSRPDPAATTTNPQDLLARYCNHLGLPHLVQSTASEIISIGKEHAFTDGRSPISIASGSIYFTTQLLGVPMTMKDLCENAGVSESTVKLVFKIYCENRDVVVKQEWLDSGKAKLDRLPPSSS
ncbi:cyclin-like protein [Fomitiporia mediterranea MF3/22]|uniref:cyclin-like protein n=1 Tax=Fomitiporia mediterranea (strain MF3/22) TaxID=694068 RepID=UPI0004408C7B|nr:cyclin-like protein [Fomitiporia mediterranea MF3/22]EJD01543.1 cyclin-like protein [Fomitiporia mediterranea MF3/22]